MTRTSWLAWICSAPTVYGAAHVFDLPFIFGNFKPSLIAKAIRTRLRHWVSPGRSGPRCCSSTPTATEKVISVQ